MNTKNKSSDGRKGFKKMIAKNVNDFIMVKKLSDENYEFYCGVQRCPYGIASKKFMESMVVDVERL